MLILTWLACVSEILRSVFLISATDAARFTTLDFTLSLADLLKLVFSFEVIFNIDGESLKVLSGVLKLLLASVDI